MVIQKFRFLIFDFRLVLPVLGVIFFANYSSAQSTFLPLSSEGYHMIDRFEIKSGDSYFHNSHKPFSRKEIALFAEKSDTSVRMSVADRYNIFHLFKETSEWTERGEIDSKKPLLKHFYKTKTDFFEVKQPDFWFKINPIIHFQYGREKNVPEHKYINSRGIELRGAINNKIGFYSMVTENQAFFPEYVQRKIYSDPEIEALPGEAYFKEFQSTTLNNDSIGSDYFSARGYITFNITKNISTQFGHDKNFIGNGYRSLVLSDHSAPYLFLKLNTKIWKFDYQNLFMELTRQYDRAGDFRRPKKYAAMHHLSLNVTKWMNVGIFEMVVIDKDDGIEAGYLNPLIFYRWLEVYLGSPDNAMVGADYKINFLKRFSLYGQFLLDEFRFSQVRTGWWANKLALQTGLKYIDVFNIQNLDVQVEHNIVRPYTYTHSEDANLTHYNQPMAHPLGANFNEWISIVRYQPLPKLFMSFKTFYFSKGEDRFNTNWGGNIFLDYNTHEMEFGNKVGQGVNAKTLLSEMALSYMIKHNAFFDVKYLYRYYNSAYNPWDMKTNFMSFGFRLNMQNRGNEF